MTLRRIALLWAVWVLSVAVVGIASAQAPGNFTITTPAPDRRIALVIRNGAYRVGSTLANPTNDARAMAEKLKTMGFEVIEALDATQSEMNRAIGAFGLKLAPAATSLFYYAGHGLQVSGRNYLVPIDAELLAERTVRLEAIDVDAVIEQMTSAGSRTNFVILDACRNNPFERRFRSTSGGLASIDAPSGTLIAYATSPGKVAADGTGPNGLYTGELLRAIDVEGIGVEEVFKRTRIAVIDKSSGAQTPWESSSLTGDFYFKPKAQIARAEAEARELALWGAVKDTGNPVLLQSYLDQYPQGTFAAVVRSQLADINAVQSQTQGSARLALTEGPGTYPAQPGGSFRDCPSCPEMVVVPAGSFFMGSTMEETHREGIPDEYGSKEWARRPVRVRHPFAIGKFPITRAEFAEFVKSSGYVVPNGCYVFDGGKSWPLNPSASWKDPGYPQTDRDPAVCLSWHDAQAYVQWLSRASGKTYRLLTEAEWEYAARGGTTTIRWWGDDAAGVCTYANGIDQSYSRRFEGGRESRECDDGFVFTSPVGSFKPNPFGLHDMLGNAWQVVEDCWKETYDGAPEDSATPVLSPGCRYHPLRGGSWSNAAGGMRVARRGRLGNDDRNDDTGFRVARSPDRAP